MCYRMATNYLAEQLNGLFCLTAVNSFAPSRSGSSAWTRYLRGRNCIVSLVLGFALFVLSTIIYPVLASYAFCQTTPIDESKNERDPLLQQRIYQYCMGIQPGGLIFDLGEVLPRHQAYIVPCRKADDPSLILELTGGNTPPSETWLIHVDWPIFM